MLEGQAADAVGALIRPAHSWQLEHDQGKCWKALRASLRQALDEAETLLREERVHPERDQERLLAWLPRVLRFADARGLPHWLSWGASALCHGQCGRSAPKLVQAALLRLRPAALSALRTQHGPREQARVPLAADVDAAAVAARVAAWQASDSAVEGLLLGLAPTEALLLCAAGLHVLGGADTQFAQLRISLRRAGPTSRRLAAHGLLDLPSLVARLMEDLDQVMGGGETWGLCCAVTGN